MSLPLSNPLGQAAGGIRGMTISIYILFFLLVARTVYEASGKFGIKPHVSVKTTVDDSLAAKIKALLGCDRETPLDTCLGAASETVTGNNSKLQEEPKLELSNFEQRSQEAKIELVVAANETAAEASLCKPETKCKIQKNDTCQLLDYIETRRFPSGLILTISESNMNSSKLEKFCLYNPILVVHQDESITQSISYTNRVKAIYKVPGQHKVTLFPGWGRSWVGAFRNLAWPDYSTGILVNNNICFWPKVPRLSESENDISLWTESNSSLLEKAPVQVKKAMISGGFFGNFWHAAYVFNAWCEVRNQADMHLVVETTQPGNMPPYIYRWAEALGISSERLVQHVGPIIADEVYATPFGGGSGVDWSCLHGVLYKEDLVQGNKHALVYFRPHSGTDRGIPEKIHLKFVNLLSKRIPGLEVKTFYGSESFEDTQRLFSNANIVIGPHGAGLVNLVFCPPLTPVVEFISPTVDNRPWQMFGGHTFNLLWWPVFLDSFDARHQIFKATAVVQKALEFK